MLILVALMCALFGLTFVVGAAGLTYASLFFFVGVRMVIGGAPLLGYQWWRHGIKIQRHDLYKFIAMSVTFILLPFAAESFALQYLPAAKVSLLWSLEPFITALFSWYLFSERLTKLKFLGMIIAFSGVLLSLVHQTGRELLLRSIAGFSTADIALALCVILTSWSWITFRDLVRKGYSAFLVNGLAMFLGGIWALGLSRFFEAWQPVPITPLSAWPIVALCIGTLIVIGNFASYNLYGVLLKRYSATFLSSACGSIPFFTLFFERLILGRPVGIVLLISLGIVTTGVLIFYRQEVKTDPTAAVD